MLSVARAAHNGRAIIADHQENGEFTGAEMARIEVKSEITGTVWQVKSKPGDKVESGDTLVVIESMKMEIPVITEDGGVVKEILVKEKDPVAEGQVVAILEG
jgi:acetyl-CoA carboxylase biotin carboxyl carrier protein